MANPREVRTHLRRMHGASTGLLHAQVYAALFVDILNGFSNATRRSSLFAILSESCRDYLLSWLNNIDPVKAPWHLVTRSKIIIYLANERYGNLTYNVGINLRSVVFEFNLRNLHFLDIILYFHECFLSGKRLNLTEQNIAKKRNFRLHPQYRPTSRSLVLREHAYLVRIVWISFVVITILNTIRKQTLPVLEVVVKIVFKPCNRPIFVQLFFIRT